MKPNPTCFSNSKLGQQVNACFPFCIAKDIKSPAIPCTREVFWKGVRSPRTTRIKDKILKQFERFNSRQISWEVYKDFVDREKVNAWVLVPQCKLFRNNHRANQDALEDSKCVVLDLDLYKWREPLSCEAVTLYKKMIKPKLKKLKILLVTLSHSRLALKVICEKPTGMSIADAQKWLAEELELPLDESGKDWARCMFLTDEESLFYINEKRLIELGDEHHPIVSDEPCSIKSNSHANPATTGLIKTNSIAAKWLERHGGWPKQGTRHETLLRMAMDLLPSFGLPEYEVRNELAWVINNVEPGITPEWRNIMNALQEECSTDDSETESNEEKFQSLVPLLPESLKASIRGFSPDRQLVALMVALTAACPYADQTWTRGCGNSDDDIGEMLYPQLLVFVVAPPASGKSVFMRLVEDWIKLLFDEEASARQKLQEWRDSNQNTPRPHVLRQIIAPNATVPALVQRTLDAEGHTIFFCCDEISMWWPTSKNEQKIFGSFYRAGANREPFGDERVGKESVSGICYPAPAGVLAGTWNQLEDVVNSGAKDDGLASRMGICILADSQFTPRPKAIERTAEELETIRAACLLLRKTKGEVRMPMTRMALREWDEETRKDAIEQGNVVKDLYRRRAADIAIRYASIYQLLSNPSKESPETGRLAVMLASYILENQLLVFGDYMPKTLEQQQKKVGRYTDVLSKLPDPFTREDIIQLRPQLSAGGRRQMIRQWIKDKKIIKPNPDVLEWQKVKS